MTRRRRRWCSPSPTASRARAGRSSRTRAICRTSRSTERCLQVIGDFLAEHDRARAAPHTTKPNPAGRRGDANEFDRMKFAGLAIAGALMPYPSATPASADLDPAHKGGTMRLLAVGAGGDIDPHVNYTLQYWQLYQSIYDGLVDVQARRRRRGLHHRSRSGGGAAGAGRRRQELHLQDPQGDQVLERPGADREGRGRLAAAHLQGQEPDRGRLLRGHRRAPTNAWRRRTPARSKAASSATRRLAPSPST